MSRTTSLHIPAWLAGATAALLIAAAVRVAEVGRLEGIVELAQMVALVGSCAYGLVIAERYEAHPLAHVYFWPSRKLRKLLFLALLVSVDCYFILIFVLGGRFVDRRLG